MPPPPQSICHPHKQTKIPTAVVYVLTPPPNPVDVLYTPSVVFSFSFFYFFLYLTPPVRRHSFLSNTFRRQIESFSSEFFLSDGLSLRAGWIRIWAGVGIRAATASHLSPQLFHKIRIGLLHLLRKLLATGQSDKSEDGWIEGFLARAYTWSKESSPPPP